MFGLVLEGGGAKGAYQIGAWKALRELNIDIGGVAGTSVGALNGAMILQGDFEKAWNIWYDISFDKIINNIDEKEIEAIRNKEVRPENLIFAVKKLRELFSERGLDITPLRKLISENVSEDKIRSSGKDFGIVTVELTDLKPVEIYIEDIPYGKLADYLLASANLPIFKMEKIDGKLFIDGGVF
ncbi:MAG TPA: patatin-like phospholipase family protein, partial [Tepidanaerobacter syntrophicus]